MDGHDFEVQVFDEGRYFRHNLCREIPGNFPDYGVVVLYTSSTPQTPQFDYDAIAHQANEQLKKRRAKGEISTFEVLMKINGYKWGDKELEQLEELDLFEVHERLLRLIKKGKEYVADFSAYEGMCVGLPYNVPFVFRKK